MAQGCLGEGRQCLGRRRRKTDGFNLSLAAQQPLRWVSAANMSAPAPYGVATINQSTTENCVRVSYMVEHFDEECLVDLERQRELTQHLPHGVHLQRNNSKQQ